MPHALGSQAWRGVLAGSFTAVGGIDPDPDPGTVAPAMPTTAKDGTWQLQASQDFNITCPAGQFLATYGGTASASDIGSMQFGAYTYGTSYRGGYTDTRGKQTKTITLTTISGSATISSSAAFTSANYCVVGAYLEGSGIPTETRFLAIANTSTATMNKAATASATITCTIRADFGYYDQNQYSVGTDSTLRLHVSTIDGRHHVGALRPKLNGSNTSPYGVLGGRFTYCMRVPSAINTYKVAHLMWPDSDVSNPDGEIDHPEANLFGGDTVTMFTHWQGGGGQYSDPSTTVMADGAWHTYCFEWRPNPTTPSLSTLKGYVDGTQIANRTGVLVPNTKMHWVWQTETFLSYTLPMDDTAFGDVEYAWATYEKMV